jgi:hypothetical protein
MALKIKKIGGGLLAVLLVIILILAAVFFFYLGPTVKMVAEKVGSKALGTPLTISELDINPRKGTLHMTGFAVANHDVFGQTNAISLASLDIAMDVGSIFSSTVVVHRVQLQSPHFVYEQDDATDNIARFLENILDFAGIDPDLMDEEPLEEEEEEEIYEPKAVLVEQLEINDIRFYLANTKAPELDIDARIESLNISMTNGLVQLKNLHISNPDLFETPNLFTLDNIEVEIDPETIYSDTISIRDVRIDRPYAYLEQNPETDTVAAFMQIAGRLTASKTNAAEEVDTEALLETAPEDAADLPQPVELHNLVVSDIQIQLLDTVATNAATEPKMLAGIDAISVKLMQGKLTINGITVPNPEGYQATNLFHLGAIAVTLDSASIFTEQVGIDQILIDSPLLNLEQTETSGNFADLQTTLMGFVPPEGAVEGAPTPEAVPQSGERPEPIPLDEQPVVLHELLVTNFLVTLSLPQNTNETASLGSNLKKMQPLEKLHLEKLNPLHKSDEATKTNAIGRAEAPLDFVFFDLLKAEPLEGMLTITGLGVANTHRFSNEHLVTIREFSIKLDPDTLQSDVLMIEKILITEPRVDYERQLTTDNIKDLKETLEQAVARRSEYEEKEPEIDETLEPDEGSKVIITHLLVKSGLVRAKLSALPSAPIPLPTIEMKDLGKEEGGATIGQALSKIGGKFYDSILGAISGTTGFAMDALKGAGTLTLDTLGKATGLKKRLSLSRQRKQESRPEAHAASRSGGIGRGGPSRFLRGNALRRSISALFHSALRADITSRCILSAPRADTTSHCVLSAPRADTTSHCVLSAPRADTTSRCVLSAPRADTTSHCILSAPRAETTARCIMSAPRTEATPC